MILKNEGNNRKELTLSELEWCKYNDWSCPHIDTWGKCKSGIENCPKDKDMEKKKNPLLKK